MQTRRMCRTPENPEGWLPLAVAENKLCTDMFLEKLATLPSRYPEWVMHYNTPRGISSLRKSLATLMTETFLEGHPIDAASICVSSACSGILDNLFYLLGDEGQGVMIPAPYYPSFDNDLEVRARLSVYFTGVEH
jgi:1-aminocyclopropane-1-carboxylate synthase